MLAATIRRSLAVRLVALVAALAIALTVARPAAARADTWTETASRENVLVQRCAGADLVTSYTLTRDYRVVTRGTHPTLWEQRHIRFAGTVANANTGMSLAYAGHYTRTADLEAGTVAISGMWLQLIPPGADPIVVTLTKYGVDLTESPLAVLMTIGPTAVTSQLCTLLGDEPAPGAGTPAELHDCALIYPRGRPC